MMRKIITVTIAAMIFIACTGTTAFAYNTNNADHKTYDLVTLQSNSKNIKSDQAFLDQSVGATSTDISDSDITLILYDNGQFTMKNTSDGKWVLYPSATSYISINVDGTIYAHDSSIYYPNADAFLDNYISTSLTQAGNIAYIVYTLPENVEITQKFELSGKAVKFTTEAVNLDGASHAIEVRYLFDTQLDLNDGSPLYAPGIGTKTYETDIPNPQFSMWKGYDIYPNPNFESKGSLSTQPDRIVFAYWPYAVEYAWDYTPDPNQRFDSDSCVLLYWDIGTLHAGGTGSAVTYYGVGVPGGTDISAVEDALDRYQQRINRFYDDYAKALAEADAKIYKKTGDDSATNVVNYFGYRADVVDQSAVSEELRDALNDYVDITDNESEIIYSFTKEIYESGNVNQGMSEEVLKSVFYAYYMGTVSEQQHFITGDDGTVGMQYMIDEFNQDFDTAKSAFLEDLESASLSQSEIDLLAESIHKATELVDEYNCLYENDPIVAQAYVDGELIGIGEYEIEQNLLPIIGGAYVAKIAFSYMVLYYSAPVVYTLTTSAASSLSSLAATPTTTVSTPISPNINHRIIKTATRVSAGSGKLAELLKRGSEPLSIERIEDVPLILEIQRQQFLEHIKWSYETCDDLEDTLEKLSAAFSLEIDELNVPKISSPDELGGSIGTGHGYVVIKNNHPTETLKPAIFISAQGTPVDPFIGEIAINDPIPYIAPEATEKISFNYTVNLVEQSHVCTVYHLTTSVVYYTTLTPPGGSKIIPLVVESDMKTVAFIACDETDTALADAMESFTTATVAEDRIEEGDSAQHTHETLDNTDRTTFSLIYPGSDLDLHIYDSQRNHVGVNYDTGEIENEILNTAHSGSNTNPEWVTIENSGGETYTTEVVAMQTNGEESYSVLAIESPELPALLGISPSNLTVFGSQDDTIERTVIISEYGGFNDLSGISITASDLTDGVGGVILSSSLTFDMPSTEVPSGSAMIANLTIDIPTDAAGGRTYSGIITAEDDSGAVDTTQININVDPAECPLDMNDDGYVNAQDIVYLLTHGEWGNNQGHVWDLNDDGYVNAQDVVYALTHGQWGACP